MPEKCGQSHAKCRSLKSPLINALKSHLQQQHQQHWQQQQLGSKLLNLLRPHATDTHTHSAHSKHTHSKHTWRMRNLRNCNRNSINSTRLTRLLQPPPALPSLLLLITKENVKSCTWCSFLSLSLSRSHSHSPLSDSSPFHLFVQQIRFDKLLQNLQKRKQQENFQVKTLLISCRLRQTKATCYATQPCAVETVKKTVKKTCPFSARFKNSVTQQKVAAAEKKKRRVFCLVHWKTSARRGEREEKDAEREREGLPEADRPVVREKGKARGR